MVRKLFYVLLALLLSEVCSAQNCFDTSITSPSPFLGNDGEIVKLDDGTLWEIKYAYEYMYEYYPSAVICPRQSFLIVNGKKLDVVPLGAVTEAGSVANSSSFPANSIEVIQTFDGCDYFVADGPAGLYVLEWYGGYMPTVGDRLVGDVASYGMKDIYYISNGSEGRVWVEEYLESASGAAQEIDDHCY
jgi:hypothetical protein